MTAQLPAVVGPDPWATLYESSAFDQAERTANMLAKCLLIPKHLRDNPESIVMALAIARGMGENPVHVLQSIYFVQGRPGWSAQYLIAKVNGSGLLKGPIRYRIEGEGKSLAVTAYATLREPEGEEVSFTASMALADAEGWSQRNPKYRTCPDLMLRYRAATLLARTHFPHVLMGFYERHELVDAFGAGEEPEYIDPPSSRSSRPPRPGEGQAALLSGAMALQAATSEDDGPSLVPSSPDLSPPVSSRRGDGTSSSAAAVPGVDLGASSPAEAVGSIPTPPASPSLAPEALQAPDTTPVGAAEASGQGAAAPATGGRITRAKLARQQAERVRKSETEEQKAERQRSHHASWKEAYKGFAKDLAALQIPEADIDTVSAWCDYRAERAGKPILRPSHRSPETRRELLQLLGSEKGQAAFLRWADELVDMPAEQTPQVFASPEVAIAWGMDKGVFENIEQAREAYDLVRREGQPANAHEMAAMWVAEVQSRAMARRTA